MAARGTAGPARFAVSAHFLVMGLTGGVWMARIPAAKSQVHLSDGTLGVALFAVPVGLVLGAALAERLVDRVGSALLVPDLRRRQLRGGRDPGLARSLPELMAALFAIGVPPAESSTSPERPGRPRRGRLRPAGDDLDARLLQPRRHPRLAGRRRPRLGRRRAAPLAGRRRRGRRAHRRHRGPWLLPEAPRSALALVGAAPRARAPGQLYGRCPRPGPSGPGPRGHRSPSALRPLATQASANAPSARAKLRPDARRRVRRLVLALGVLGVCGLVGEGAAGDWSAVYLGTTWAPARGSPRSASPRSRSR